MPRKDFFTEEQKEKINAFEVVTYRKRKVARYPGDKSSNVCPRCGNHSYYVAQGGRVRRKECSVCGFDSSYNEYSKALKRALRRGNLEMYTQSLYERVLKYQQSLLPLKETTN